MKPKVLIRLSKRFLIVATLLVLVTGSSAPVIPVRASDSKIVYVAICVDTEMMGGFGGAPVIGSTDPHPTLDVSEYSRTVPSTVAAVFNSDFRNSHRDSFGNIFKMSWFAEMDYLVAQSNFVWADGSPAGVSGYTATRDLLMNNWGTGIQTYGDSVEYHHHFMIYDGTWKRYNNGPDAGYPEYQMYALDHMIIDRNFYPSSWRSGDWIMPPALSSWLEQWMPFDYTPAQGIWYPFHPSGMDRWQTKCPYSPNVYTSTQAAFAYASANGSAIYSICTHDTEDMKYQVEWLQWCLNHWDAAETTYPNVSFKYVSAREAMQLALGFTDFTPPTFTVTPSSGTYAIVSSETLWKNHPYIALKYTNGTYGHMSATPAGINTWTVTPPTGVSSIGVAGSDLCGNPGTATYSAPVQRSLTVASAHDSPSPTVGVHSYADGTSVTASVSSPVTEGSLVWTCTGWTGTGSVPASGSAATVTFSITADSTITWTWSSAPVEYTLTVNTVGSGSVNRNNTGPYHYGDVVQLTTVAAAGWSFQGWSGDLLGSTNPTTLVIDGNKAVTATFTQDQYTLTVTISGSGSVSKLPNEATYTWGTNVTLTATSAIGWSFAGWSGDALGASNPITINMTGNKAVTAAFTRNTYALTINIAGSGNVNLNNTGPYYYGDVVQLTAVPVIGWSFDHWGGDLSGSANPTTLLINGNKAVSATFTQNVYTLTVTTTGSGSVNRNSTGPYHYGDVVELTAVPATGWSFDHWSGDLSGSNNPKTIIINGNKDVTATFMQNMYTLNITVVGSGSVNQNNTGPYHYGDAVELTAVAATGWSFQGWSGDLLGSANPATILMDGNKAVTATFIQNAYSLTVSIVGSGSVAKVPDQASYHLGDVVQLTPTPAAGWSFSAWSGDISGSLNPVSVIINGTTSVTATFVQNAYSVSVTVLPSSAAGTVTPNATGPYHYGDLVVLTESPSPGYTFSGWSGDGSGTGSTRSVTVTGNMAVTASFVRNTYRITVTQGANGVISPGTIEVEYGSDEAFTITPDNGYHIFDVVVDDIPQGAVSSYLFSNVVANHTISASFAIDVYKPFSVVSNSTISELAFNSTSQVLSFTAGGPSGTTGFSNVTISKTLIADVSGLEVYLDGTKTSYVVSDLTTSWLIYITYQHSTHKIVVNFALPPGARADYVSYIALVAILGLIVAFVLTVFAKRRGKSSQSEARARS